MKSPADSHEMTILESKGILIQDQIFHAVLTDRRIILTRYIDNRLSIRSIYFIDIQKIEEDMDYSGDPVLIVVTTSANVKTKKVVLHFTRKNFPDPFKERSLWVSEINRMLRPVFRGSPAPVPKKPPVTKAFCTTCGTKITDGSAFCTKCGTKIIYPAHSLPPRQSDTSPRKGVKIVEIPVTKIELPQEERPIPDTSDSYKEEKIPPGTPLHKEHEERKHEEKKSFFAKSGKRKYAVIALFVLVCVIVLIVAFFVLVPSGSTGFNLTLPGMNFTVPSENVTPSTTSKVVKTPTIPKTTRTPATPVQTRTPVRNTTPV